MFTPMIANEIAPIAVPIPTITQEFLLAQLARSVRNPMNFVATGSRAVPIDSLSSSMAIPNLRNCPSALLAEAAAAPPNVFANWVIT